MLVQALVGENHGSEDTRLLLERVDDACSQISGILVATVGEEKGKQRMSISVLAVELLWLNTGPLAVESLLRRVHDNVGYNEDRSSCGRRNRRSNRPSTYPLLLQLPE